MRSDIFLCSTLVAALAAALAAAPATAVVTYGDPSQYEIQPGMGIASLITTFADGSTGRCSGALIDGAVVTAAHCFVDKTASPTRGAAVSTEISFDGGVTSIEVQGSDIEINAEWTGDVLASPADIAVVRLPQEASPGVAPFAVPTFEIKSRPVGVLIAGYGGAGEGVVDPALTPAVNEQRTLRIGFNHYDAPPPLSNPYWDEWLLYDFDNFTSGKNVLGEPGWVTLPGGGQSIPELDWNRDGSSVFGESMIAPGDSGGPSYFDNILVGVHSWISASPKFGERSADGIYPVADGPEDVAFGWVGADVNVARYSDWIMQAASRPSVPPPAVVPVPPAFALLVTAFGFLGICRWWTGRRCRGQFTSGAVNSTAAGQIGVCQQG